MLVSLSDKIASMVFIITGGKKGPKKWMQKMVKSPKFEEGALRKHFGLKKDEKVTISMIEKELKRLEDKYPEGGYSKSDLELQKQLVAARTMMSR